MLKYSKITVWKCNLLLRSDIYRKECTKGQLISKRFLGVVDFLQKTKENKSTWSIIVVKSNSFIRFLEEIDAPNEPFRNQMTFSRVWRRVIVWGPADAGSTQNIYIKFEMWFYSRVQKST